MYIITGETLDKFKGYHYYVCDVTTAQHKEPYVAVSKNNIRVARIEIRNDEIKFYPHTPNDVILDKQTLVRWITRNKYAAKVCWNNTNPDYRMD
jgi:hypothetical protein